MRITAFLFLLFGVLSLGLGIAMLIDKTLLNQFSETARTVFIGMLFGYGVYRVWTAISNFRKNTPKQTP
jgi:hypothetical protein